ncbi:Dual oxidase 1 [Frankliniella fusca]|uniref:Dual oxidase 1 n=1 Tax=Frankliniella fusca TaxID=407009 RepID=A0AAE1HLL8_9NEOP|nr:Dual oxidase 1 [Frankliniella fusca]
MVRTYVKNEIHRCPHASVRVELLQGTASVAPSSDEPPEESLYVCQRFGYTKMIFNSQLFMDAQTCDRGFLPLLPVN